MTPPKTKQVRYALVGAGNIAQVAVLPAFEHAQENSRLVAVISSDPEKLSALRETYELELCGDYDQFEAVLEQGRIDAVYIATPNALHREFAVRAALRGVHVLCEKPLAPSVADCHAIAEACRENETRLMVAYRLHFEEANLSAIELVRSGKLGQPRMFSSFFSHVVRPGDIRRQPELGGGATLDLGVYCINAARHLFDAEPSSVFANVVEKSGTDDTTFVLLTFPNDCLAQFCVSNSGADVSSFRIAGDLGDLRLEPAYEYAGENVQYLTLDGDTKRTVYKKRDQFAPEIVYFSNCILTGTEPEPSVEEGLCDVRVVEAIFESARTGVRVALAPYQRRRRPSLAQEMHKPAISKPQTVNAPDPSVR